MEDDENMEKSVLSAMEKIKQQEQDTEAKLREMREFDAAVMSINRATRNTLAHVEKLKKECGQVKSTIDKLQSQVAVEREGRNALLHMVERCHVELDSLRHQSDEGVSTVWTGRSSLLEAVQNVSDTCDVWALFTRPAYSEAVTTEKQLGLTTHITSNKDRLKEAIVRRTRAIADRDRLLNEPDVGEEYIRIKNALQYSMEMSANVPKSY